MQPLGKRYDIVARWVAILQNGNAVHVVVKERTAGLPWLHAYSQSGKVPGDHENDLPPGCSRVIYSAPEFVRRWMAQEVEVAVFLMSDQK